MGDAPQRGPSTSRADVSCKKANDIVMPRVTTGGRIYTFNEIEVRLSFEVKVIHVGNTAVRDLPVSLAESWKLSRVTTREW